MLTASRQLYSIGNAQSAELLTNGNFESGSFAGWTASVLGGSSGNLSIDTPGTSTPVSGQPSSAAGGGAHGNFYAVSDQTGPGTYALIQSFSVNAGQTILLNFDMFANDWSNRGPIIGPQGLSHIGAANQHVRVDILSGAATAFQTGAAVLANLYSGVDVGLDPNPFTHYVFDISSIVAGGGTFQLRFAQVDNQSFFNMGVDNVSLTAVPEPASLLLAGIGLAGLGFVRRKHSKVS